MFMIPFRLMLVISLSWLGFAVGSPAETFTDIQARQAREANEDVKNLADKMPRPISTQASTANRANSVHQQVFSRLTTLQGACVAGVSLLLTLLICRPRKPKRAWPSAVSPYPVYERTPNVVKSLVDQFRDSMAMNYMRWHDGLGYDVHLIDQAAAAERAEIEALVLAEPVADWYVVEALSRLHTPAAIARLRSTLAASTQHEVKIAICEYGADILTSEQRTAVLVAALREASITQGVPRALRVLADFHPPATIDALLEASLEREGDVAIHCAALVMFLHGKASSAFDRAHLPFLQRFTSKVPGERASAYEELRTLVGR